MTSRAPTTPSTDRPRRPDHHPLGPRGDGDPARRADAGSSPATSWSSAAAPPAPWPRSPPPSAGADVLLLEKAHVRHSGALAMGMDGVNNAVIPGKADPDDYVAEITRANDGIVNQRTVRQTATRGFAMVQRLESYGVKFEKDEHGEYAVRQVHRSGSYVLPMPEGKDVKKVLYRRLRRREIRERMRIENRVMPVRVLTVGRPGGRRGRLRHPHRRVRHGRAQARSSWPPAPAAGSACPPAATSTAPTRTPPTPATATPWPTTRAPSSPASSASRSTR